MPYHGKERAEMGKNVRRGVLLALAVGEARDPAEKRAVPMTRIFTNIIE